MSLLKSSKGDTPKKSSGKTFAGNKMWFVFAIMTALAGAGLVFAVLANVVSTTTYYVLNQDVPARSQITPEMLTEVVTNDGGQPRNALSIADVQMEPTYAKFGLHTGDIVTASNTGGFSPLSHGIPEDFVVASFTADANNAVAGKLETGNYIDLIAVNADGTSAEPTAKYALRHVLLMDVSTDPSAIGESEAAVDENGNPIETSAQDQLRTGIPSLYTVALPQEDAATLALIRDLNLLVVLSPESANDEFKDADIQKSLSDVMGDNVVKNSGEGTDPAKISNDPEDAAAVEEAPAESETPAPTSSATPSETPAE